MTDLHSRFYLDQLRLEYSEIAGSDRGGHSDYYLVQLLLSGVAWMVSFPCIDKCAFYFG